MEAEIVRLGPRGKGRRTKLTDALQRRMVELVGIGAPLDSACRAVGIDPWTGQRWLAWGRAVLALRAGKQVDLGALPDGRLPHKAARFAAFAEAVEHALAQDEINRVAQISQAAIGGSVVGRRTTERTTKDGTVTVTTDERLAPPAWEANAWMLERSRRDRWGRDRRDKGGNGGPSFAEVVEMVWDKLAGHDPRRALGGPEEDRTSGTNRGAESR